MPLLLVVLALGVVAVTAALATSRIGRMPDAPFDREPADMPSDRWILGRDLDRTRFALGVRGYRMDQVDDILDRLARDLVQRDGYTAQLESLIDGAGVERPARPEVAPVGVAPVEAADTDAAPTDEHEDDAARG